MNKTEPNEMAFPIEDKSYKQSGLTKREYFAAKAIQGLIASREPYKGKDLTQTAVKIADELIKALNEESDGNS